MYHPLQLTLDLIRKGNIIQENNKSAGAKFESIDLQSSLSLKYLFEKRKCMVIRGAEDRQRFHILRNYSLKCLAVFGTTYLIENTFLI